MLSRLGPNYKYLSALIKVIDLHSPLTTLAVPKEGTYYIYKFLGGALYSGLQILYRVDVL